MLSNERSYLSRREAARESLGQSPDALMDDVFFSVAVLALLCVVLTLFSAGIARDWRGEPAAVASAGVNAAKPAPPSRVEKRPVAQDGRLLLPNFQTLRRTFTL